MQSPEDFIHRVCTSKLPFRSAAKARDWVIERGGEFDHKLYTYQCPHCEHWHLTKIKPEERKPQPPLEPPVGFVSKLEMAQLLGVSDWAFKRIDLLPGIPRLFVGTRRMYNPADVIPWYETTFPVHGPIYVPFELCSPCGDVAVQGLVTHGCTGAG